MDVAAALVVVSAALATARLIPLAVALPFLIASSLGRRFASSAIHAEVTEEGQLELGGKRVDDIREAWLEDGTDEPRVVVACGDARDLAVLYFENREQAKRFAGAFPGRTELVVGYRPRRVDLLSPARFVAIAFAFASLGSWYGALTLVFVPLALRNFFGAKQLIVHGDTFELRTAFDAETFQRAGIVAVDIDDGIITLKGDRELKLASANVRDPHLNAPTWTDLKRRHALKHLASRPTA